MELTFNAIKMIPKSSFKDLPTADTIFSGIANAVKTLFGSSELEFLIKSFEATATISSAFPYESETYYFPKPLNTDLWLFKKLKESNEEDWYSKFKDLKHVKYLPLEEFTKALHGELFKIPPTIPTKKINMPKVALDRVTQASDMYYIDMLLVKPGSGLYFLYIGPEELFENYLIPAIKLLGDTGLGGKSTWGIGTFNPKFEKISISTPESEYAVTLSNAVVEKESLLFWKFKPKGGWSGLRRKPKIHFIAEGSIIKRSEKGKLLRLDGLREHPVYVHAKTSPIPIEVGYHDI